MIPILKGDGFCLRGFSWADFDAFAGMWSEPEVAEYIPFAPLPPDECWNRINGNLSRWVTLGIGQWCLANADGRCVGVVGFFENRLAVGTLGHDAELMAGWVLSSRVHGQGYGTKAVKLMHDWLDHERPAARVVCGMHKDNVGSIRLAEKNGYEFLIETMDEDGPGQLMLRRSGVEKLGGT